MCECPFGIDIGHTTDLAERAARAGLGNLIGLQARMAPSIRYTRDLVAARLCRRSARHDAGRLRHCLDVGQRSAHAYAFDATNHAAVCAHHACVRRTAVRSRGLHKSIAKSPGGRHTEGADWLLPELCTGLMLCVRSEV
jgi:predicted dehydrogenase